MMLTTFTEIVTFALPLLLIQSIDLWRTHFRPRKQDRTILILLLIFGFAAITAWAERKLDYRLAPYLLLIVTLAVGHIRYVKHVRKALVRADKLRTISELAAGVSHEVRNPLTVTRGFISLMRQPDLSKEKKETFIALALEELDRAQQIITDYLSFAKPRQEQLKPIQVAEELRYVQSVMQPLANLKQVELSIHAKEGCILGDCQQFRQVIMNLLKNAIEAVPPNGKVETHTRVQGPMLAIIITDNGEGIAPEDVRRIGTPFFSTKENGTGLGMMVVYSIVQSMGGTMKIQSELGKGSSFSIMLPWLKMESYGSDV